jgi:hypothetical protein
MPEFCTCGAQLPPDAVFCHKCGKPQREGIEPEIATPAPAPVAPVAAPPAPFAAVNFHNPVAVRIALLVGVAAMFCSWLPLVNWLAGGFFAVFFYRRRTRDLLNVGAGAKMGWITGVIMFTMWSILFMFLGLSGKLAEQLQEQLKSLPYNDPSFAQAAHYLASPAGLLVLLAMGFVFITCLSIAGGAIGAKIVGRD